ncbi:MAG: hypothetical protein KA474_08940 [Acinetobacter sp.]|uniref:hypothetical protein n=1 Tax=Acinetobacter guillouiae TaxID=106649 RepID=UPI000F99F307|nr:hypothetical protein [Acinetobacter sp.]
MSQVDLSKIKEIIEEDNITSVNYRLDNGWQLLAISSGSYDDGDSQKAYFLYTLGHTEKQPLPNVKFNFGSES